MQAIGQSKDPARKGDVRLSQQGATTPDLPCQAKTLTRAINAGQDEHGRVQRFLFKGQADLPSA